MKAVVKTYVKSMFSTQSVILEEEQNVMVVIHVKLQQIRVKLVVKRPIQSAIATSGFVSAATVVFLS